MNDVSAGFPQGEEGRKSVLGRRNRRCKGCGGGEVLGVLGASGAHA